MLLIGMCKGLGVMKHGVIYNWPVQKDEVRLMAMQPVKEGYKAVVLLHGQEGKLAIGIQRESSKIIHVVMSNSKGAGGILSHEHTVTTLREKFSEQHQLNPITTARKMYYGLVAQSTGFKNLKTKNLLEEILMSYLIKEKSLQVMGKFEAAKGADTSKLDGIIINEEKDLAKLSVAQLTAIFNNLHEEEDHIKKFPDAKTGAKKIMEVLDAKDDFADLTSKVKAPAKAKAEKAEKAPATPRAEKFPLDNFIVGLNPKTYQTGSKREVAAEFIPEKGMKVQDFYDKCVADGDMTLPEAKGILVKLTEEIKSGAGYVVVAKADVPAAVNTFKENKAAAKVAAEAVKKAAAPAAPATKGKAADTTPPAKAPAKAPAKKK